MITSRIVIIWDVSTHCKDCLGVFGVGYLNTGRVAICQFVKDGLTPHARAFARLTHQYPGPKVHLLDPRGSAARLDPLPKTILAVWAGEQRERWSHISLGLTPETCALNMGTPWRRINLRHCNSNEHVRVIIHRCSLNKGDHKINRVGLRVQF